MKKDNSSEWKEMTPDEIAALGPKIEKALARNERVYWDLEEASRPTPELYDLEITF